MKKILIYIILLLSIFLLSVPVWANEKLEICNKHGSDCSLTKKDVTAIMSTQNYFEYINQCESKTVKVSNIENKESNSYIIYGECIKPKFVELLSVSNISTKFENMITVIGFLIFMVFMIIVIKEI